MHVCVLFFFSLYMYTLQATALDSSGHHVLVSRYIHPQSPPVQLCPAGDTDQRHSMVSEPLISELVHVHIHDEPQLPWLRTAIYMYHTDLDVKMKLPNAQDVFLPIPSYIQHSFILNSSSYSGAAGSLCVPHPIPARCHHILWRV